MIALWLIPLLLIVGLLALAEGISYRLTSRRAPNERRSPAEFGLTFEEIGFPARDGVGLRGWWIPAPGSARTVIFLHGQGGSMDPDVQYAPALHAAGFNVLMFDFRAHGRSQGDFVSVGYLERQDVLGALDWLAQRGQDRVGLLGFSMGGAVAMLTAPIAPQVRAIVSDGGIARLTSAIVGRLAEARVPRWGARPIAWLAVLFTSQRLGVNLFAYEPMRWVGKVAPRPVFFIHGGRDPYLAPGEFETLVAAAREPKRVWRVAEAPHREVDLTAPEEYRRRIVSFFEQWV
ncbi:MAG: alpha/beta fold hydrolase [Chloroflexi bacterium]|nr:alpha/beta fold hydrolase [Chloroflexota bacterium]